MRQSFMGDYVWDLTEAAHYEDDARTKNRMLAVCGILLGNSTAHMQRSWM